MPSGLWKTAAPYGSEVQSKSFHPRGEFVVPARDGCSPFSLFRGRRVVMSELNVVQPTSYFNLHAEGCGYLNRVRTVKPEKGLPYLACTIAAKHGDATSPTTTTARPERPGPAPPGNSCFIFSWLLRSSSSRSGGCEPPPPDGRPPQGP